MDIYEFSNYKKYILNRLTEMPKKGHGQLRKLAEYLNVHSTFVSQVFHGEKELNAEQGMFVAEFFGLNEPETEYFIKLIQIERAGNSKLVKLLQKEAQQIKNQALKISNRLAVKKVLPDEQKAIFYSDWYYSAIALLIDIKGYQDIESISNYCGLPRKTVADALNFLIEAGLLIRENSEIKVGPSKTHLDADSPFIKLHHLNWRYKALEYVKYQYPEKLHYSSPMTVSKKDVEVVRAKIVKLIEEVGKVVDPSPSEELMCLNIDWFKVQPK
ncbi:MAG: TIGR02147 family protein, partial [Bdellovibrionales bacterium]